MQLRDVFAMRTHVGWAHFLMRQLSNQVWIVRSLYVKFDQYLSTYIDKNSAGFDMKYGIETFSRGDYAVTEDVPVEQFSWGYGSINHDFFREIIRAIAIDLSGYTFVDVGAGKGAAIDNGE